MLHILFNSASNVIGFVSSLSFKIFKVFYLTKQQLRLWNNVRYSDGVQITDFDKEEHMTAQ